LDVEQPMTHTFSSVTMFGASGYFLESSLLDLAAIEEVNGLLMASKDRLNRHLEEWVGESVPDHSDFARHQARISDYETKGLPKDLRHYLVGEFDLETRLDRRICRILGASKARVALTRLFDATKYYVHYPPMIRFKVAGAPGSVLPAHQDYTYNSHLKDFLTVWVPLVEIDEEVGGLVMYEGSHLEERLHHASSGPWAHGLSPAGLEKYRRVPIQMKVGDALIFPPTLIHESALQYSQTRPRLSIDFRVFREPGDTRKSYYDPFEDRVVRLD
jgi:hypothetical protein